MAVLVMALSDPQHFLQIMSGRKNVWAKAVANGDANLASRAAVEHDLDILMRLALGDRTLASMVKEAHSDTPEVWLTAGKPPKKPVSTFSVTLTCLAESYVTTDSTHALTG